MHVCNRFKPIRASFVPYLPHTAHWVFLWFFVCLFFQTLPSVYLLFFRPPLLFICCFSDSPFCLFVVVFQTLPSVYLLLFFSLSLPPPPCQGTYSIKWCFFFSFFCPTWLHHPFQVHCSSVFSTTALLLSQYEISQLMSSGFTVLTVVFCFIIIGKLITVNCKFGVSCPYGR